MRLLAVAAALLSIASCASVGRTMSYPATFADARYQAAGKDFSAWVHAREDAVMIQGSIGSAVEAGVVEGVTFGAGRVPANYPVWRAGAEAFVAPVGCEVRDLRPIDQDIAWEFDYVCPEGVDLRQLVRDQRDELRRGTPLHR